MQPEALTPTMTLTEADKAAYREHGYWISPVLYTDAEIAELRQAVTDVTHGRKDPGTRYWLSDGPPAEDDGRKTIQVVNAFWVSQRMRRAVTDPRLGAIGAQLLDTPEVLLWHDQAIYKPGLGPDGAAETAGNIGWHQDYAHWQCADAPNFVTAWVALQDTDLSNGGMRTIVGSHRWGLVKDAHTFGEKDLETLQARFTRPDQPWLDEPCILRAGQVSFHHPLTFHGSGPNLSLQPRLSFISHMMQAGTAVNEHGRHHPNLDLLGPEKRVGTPFAGPAFPRIYAAE